MASTDNKTPLKFLGRFGIEKDLDYLTENLGLLLGAGVDVSSALQSIKESVRTKRMKIIIGKMEEELSLGLPLWTVFENSGLFPKRVSSLIRIGEQTGQLVKNFKMLGEQEEKQRTFKSKVRSALMYPGFVFGVTLVVGIGVSWFILPRLATLFSQLKLKLPLVTKILLSFGTFLSKYGSIAIPLFLVALGFLFYILFFLSATKKIGEYILSSIPGVNRLLQEVELARFGSILGGLLDSGIPILEALSSLEEATQADQYKKLYAHMRKNLTDGNSLEKSFTSFKKADRLIPPPIQQLIITGSKSGNLSEVLLKVGLVFEDKSDTTTRNLGVILEPMLLFIVWIAVVSVALAVILPIYDLIGGINRH